MPKEERAVEQIGSLGLASALAQLTAGRSTPLGAARPLWVGGCRPVVEVEPVGAQGPSGPFEPPLPLRLSLLALRFPEWFLRAGPGSLVG